MLSEHQEQVAQRRMDEIQTEIGDELIGMMRSDAYLINTSRAEIVDEDALVRALTSGTIAGAAIDVYEHEPLPSDHRSGPHHASWERHISDT